MPQPHLRAHKIRTLLLHSVAPNFNKTNVANQLRIARSTATKYISAFRQAGLTSSEIENARSDSLYTILFASHKHPIQSNRKSSLIDRFSSIHYRIERDGLSLLDAWREELTSNSRSYKYTQFCSLYALWRKEHGLERRSTAKTFSLSVKPLDVELLKRWQRSHDRRKWEVGVALLGLSSGRNVSALCHQIARERRTVSKWCRAYESGGIDSLPLKRSRNPSERSRRAIEEKKGRLVKIIHEAPNVYGINRSTWSLQSLSDAYQETYGERVSRSSISEYFKSAGYKFKKAKKSLTSSDPTYRDKLNKIRSTLSQLAPKEKFFSIDEFGPFSVRIRGGTALVPADQIRTIPQRQRSKGSLICTAALELSSNQIIHFYSKRKNTNEMIKLLRRLLIRYRNENRIFLSWDSASWHASKALYRVVNEMNSDKFRNRHNTPLVELIPLPAGAQFLNVIESVFSGMSRAILHNSNYASVQECKGAIDRYFAERNRAFLEHPKRAGRKIWGKEQVEPIFREENNCKDPRWR
jgi:transposase